MWPLQWFKLVLLMFIERVIVTDGQNNLAKYARASEEGSVFLPIKFLVPFLRSTLLTVGTRVWNVPRL